MQSARTSGSGRGDTDALLSLYEETAYLRDPAEFRRVLFANLRRNLRVPLLALCCETPSGVRVDESRGPGDSGGEVLDGEVLAEQRGFLATLPNPAVTVISRAVPERALRESATFQRIWRPNGLREGVVGTSVGRDGLRSMLVLLDEDRSEGRIRRLRRFLDRVLPFVGRAIEQFASLERLSTLEQVTGTVGAAAVVDGRGRVVWISSAARETFREAIGRDTPPDDVLDACVRVLGTGAPETVLLEHRGRPLVLRSRPIRSDDRPLALVTIEDPDERKRQDFEDRCRRFGLTAREREVADLVVAGLLDKEILQILPITRDTLRRHLANVFGRTGARNRVELLRLLLGTATRPSAATQ